MRLRSIKAIMFDFPVYIITHPFKGFDDMKFLKRGDMRYAVAIMIIAGVVEILRVGYTGFMVTGFWSETRDLNIPALLLFTYSPILLFCVANWSITTITDGKGSLREIFLAYSYSMYIMIFCTILGVILSNFVTGAELAFVSFLFIFGMVAQYAYLFVGLIMIHEYTFFRAILMVIATVLAMMIITFVFALMVSLVSDVFWFFSTVYEELQMHLIG